MCFSHESDNSLMYTCWSQDLQHYDDFMWASLQQYYLNTLSQFYEWKIRNLPFSRIPE